VAGHRRSLFTLLHARARAGVAIADLTVIRDDGGVAAELIVDVRCGASPGSRQALCAWAARVGYRRAWLDAEVVELEPIPGGVAHTRCSGCRVRLVDADASFWAFVRHRGAFPSTCVLCGADLPQWTPARQTHPDRRDPHRAKTLEEESPCT